ncbi:hypothetical protein BH11ACT4_BH11ACT4_10160 [soil metagenome]
MPTSPAPVFPAETVAAVLAHMNADHNDDNLLIARAFGSAEASAATMTTLDHRGGTWQYAAGGMTHDLTLPWSVEIDERPQIRREIVALYDAACARLGIEPRPH